MMHDALPVALILLASAVAVVVVFRQLSMPAILGYLFVGALIGPHALAFVPETESQRYLAEFGVVFLMFSVGLEFSLPQLMAMRRTVFGFGGAQVAVVGRQKSSGIFVRFVLFVTLGLAWGTEQAGLSLALGAFLAGMLISETDCRYQVEDYIKPFRDVLLGLFFVTIGMLLDLGFLLDHFLAVAAVFLLLLGVKFVVIFALARAFGNHKPAALRSALALAPAGSFGFVLLALAQRAKALDEHTLQVVLAAALLSMLTTPFILARMERIVLHFIESEWTQRPFALPSLPLKAISTRPHVIVRGYARTPPALAPSP